MRSRSLFVGVLVALTAGCASTQPGVPAPKLGATAPSAQQGSSTPVTKESAARAAVSRQDCPFPNCPAAPNWATCSGGPPHPPAGCGYIPPSSSSAALFSSSFSGGAASSGTGCDSGRGLQCADGPPPPAPPSPVTCPDVGTPCGLGPRQPGTIQFAVIGDWGDNCCQPSCAHYVADMIKRWNDRWPLDFIMTTGDNFYPDGSQEALDASMPMYDWIGPRPVSGQPPRFFPTLGNHDLYEGCCGKPYQDYFQALGDYSPTRTPRYYKYSLPGGFLDLYAINADESEPDGNTKDGQQADWLRQQLAQSAPSWRIVFFHEPPFTSHHKPDEPGGDPRLDWPFAAWGATLVLTGHIHAYERIVRQDFTYVTNGLGGVKGIDNITPAEGCTQPAAGSQVVYNGSVGAMIGVATADQLRFCMMVLDRDHPDGMCVDNFSFRR